MARQFRPGQLQTGSLYNISSSYALTASYASNAGTTIDTGSFVTTSSFGAFTASYTTGSFTGSFVGDGSQLTGIVSSKWTGSNPISRQSDVEITGSLRVLGSITGSLLGTASNATTASYFNETDPIFVAKSGSFATTGSNTFIGTQTITGSNGRLIYRGTTPGVYPENTLAEVHANDDYPWLERFYNDTFSTSSAIMAYFGWSDGRFVFHNESTQSIGLQVNGFGAENGLLVYSDKVAFVNNVEVTGSLNVVGVITGSLFGTASWATNAITASYITASGVYGPYGSNSITSASYAETASYSKNIQISGSVNNVDYIDFNTGSAVPAWKSGRVFWDNTDGALSVYNAESDVTLQVGQENWTRVSNRTGTTITNGTVVRLIGAHGDVPEVERAQSLLVSGSVNLQNQILGVATHDIEHNSKGFITTQGLVRGLNTNAFNDGDTLFVGTGSAGVLQNTAPYAPYEIIPVGVCVKASPGGSGIIYVAVQEPIDFSDLSSVLVEGIYHYGDLWTYVQSGSTGVWTHTNQLSGSYGLTGSLTVTNGVTASLFGTASFATSASYAPDTTFPYTGSALVTGSLGITGSLSVIDGNGANNLNTNVRTLYGSNGSSSIDWSNRQLNAANGSTRLDWRNLYAIDSNTTRSIDWGSRVLIDANSTTAVDWSSRTLRDSSGAGILSVNWRNRLLHDTSTSQSLDWTARTLHDTSTSASLNWSSRTLSDSGTPGGSGIPVTSIDWENRQANDRFNVTSTDWSNRYLYDGIGVTSTDWTSRYLYDGSGNLSIDWGNRYLYDQNANTIIDYSGNSGYNIRNYRPTIETLELAVQDEFTQTSAGFGISTNTAGNIIQVGTNVDLAVIASNPVFLDTDGIWKRLDQTTDTTTKLLGICVEPYNKGYILTEGIITVTTSSGYSDTTPFVSGSSFYGMPVYLTGSTATFTTDKPTSGYVRVVGHMYYNSTTTPDYWIMKFNPSNDWYEI